MYPLKNKDLYKRMTYVKGCIFLFCDRKQSLHPVSILVASLTMMIGMRSFILSSLHSMCWENFEDCILIFAKSTFYEFKQLKIAMQDLSSKHIIPHMEQKIRVLNQQVFTPISDFKCYDLYFRTRLFSAVFALSLSLPDLISQLFRSL